MSIFNFFRSAKKTNAEQAKERLQIVVAHERVGRSGPDYLPLLQQELMAVIARYVDIDRNKVEVKLDRGNDCSTLEVNIELPFPAKEAPAKDSKDSKNGKDAKAADAPGKDAKDPKSSKIPKDAKDAKPAAAAGRS